MKGSLITYVFIHKTHKRKSHAIGVAIGSELKRSFEIHPFWMER